MKKIWAILTMMFVMVLTTTNVEAKKFGGGNSFGKSFNTAPSQPKKSNPGDTGANQQSAQKGVAKGGMMKGLLGGLLAGGLIAALMGGAFEGIQMMDILIIALIAFVAIRLLKGMAQTKAASMHPQAAYVGNQSNAHDHSQSQQREAISQNANFNHASFGNGTPIFGDDGHEVPFNLPDGFDINNFLAGARDHYRTLQQAWNENDLEKIREYVSADLFDHLRAERIQLAGQQNTEVMFVDAELVRANQMFGVAELSIKFSGRYRDTVEGLEEEITDIWHLERELSDKSAPWIIVGIES